MPTREIAAATAQLRAWCRRSRWSWASARASGALIAAMSDVVICSDAARLYVNGPQVVSANTGENVDAGEAGGGAAACQASGIAHDLAGKTDAEAIELAREVVGLLPDNNLEASPVDLAGSDDFNRLAPELNELTDSPDAHKVVEAIAGPRFRRGVERRPRAFDDHRANSQRNDM